MSDDTGASTPATSGESASDQADDEQKLLTTTGAEARRTSFGPGGAAGMPAEKSSNFRATLKRLGEILSDERARLWVIALFTIASVGITVLGPRLLGNAT
ncbi:MAG: hypothetical protein WA964_04150, partial [Ilumatobacter sp.]